LTGKRGNFAQAKKDFLFNKLSGQESGGARCQMEKLSAAE
jgi:hypothetical protein